MMQIRFVHMKIAVVGGTGHCGRGFILHWSREHDIIIGSRKAEKAEKYSEEIMSYLGDHGVKAEVVGMDNGSAIASSDLVVLAVPYRFVESVTKDLEESYSDQIVISLIVPMSRVEDHFEYTPPSQGSAALLVKDLLPSTVKNVSAFHTISYTVFQDLDRTLSGDVVICGDDKASKEVVAGLVRDIKNLRTLDGGPLKMAAQVEGLTPLLVNISRLNNIRDAGISVIEG